MESDIDLHADEKFSSLGMSSKIDLSCCYGNHLQAWEDNPATERQIDW